MRRRPTRDSRSPVTADRKRRRNGLVPDWTRLITALTRFVAELVRLFHELR